MYKNTHAIVREKANIRQRLNEFKEKTKDIHRPLSVLILSIDSISRLNLLRAMPKTAQHLYDSGWFELQGYNKVSKSKTVTELFHVVVGFLKEFFCRNSHRLMTILFPILWQY